MKGYTNHLKKSKKITQVTASGYGFDGWSKGYSQDRNVPH